LATKTRKHEEELALLIFVSSWLHFEMMDTRWLARENGMVYFEPNAYRGDDQPGPGGGAHPDAGGDDEPGPLRLQLAVTGASEEPAPETVPDVPEMWTFPPPHQVESIALKFSAIRYDLETRVKV
jgi:hypothetical protein